MSVQKLHLVQMQQPVCYQGLANGTISFQFWGLFTGCLVSGFGARCWCWPLNPFTNWGPCSQKTASSNMFLWGSFFVCSKFYCSYLHCLKQTWQWSRPKLVHWLSMPPVYFPRRSQWQILLSLLPCEAEKQRDSKEIWDNQNLGKWSEWQV